MVQPSLPKSGRVTRGRRHHETKLTAEQRDEPLWCDQCFAQYFAEKKGQFQMKPPLFRPTGRGASQTEVSYSSSHDPPSDATRHVSIPARSMAKLVGIERRTAKSDEGTDACAFLPPIKPPISAPPPVPIAIVSLSRSFCQKRAPRGRLL